MLSNQKKVFLADDTITKSELFALSEWMLAGNRLTKADQTLAFEQEFRDWMGSRHAIFTNSGSS